ncbi:hypothetical protein HZY86_00545 [Aerococcaceae bacterium DSM 111020]|nr:hypothetical protein [Aerococcaceae bacterium DSM 111020]
MKIRIDFVVIPISGHLNTQIELASFLDSEKYDIRFITGIKQKALIESLGYDFAPIIGATEIEDYFINARIARNDFYPKQMLNIGFGAFQWMSDSYPFVEEAVLTNRPDLMVCDYVTLQGGMVARDYNIPFITNMRTQFVQDPVCEETHVPYFLKGLKPNETPLGKLRNLIGWKIVKGTKKVGQLLNPHPNKASLYNGAIETMFSEHCILGCGMMEIEYNEFKSNAFVSAGPICSFSKSMEYIPLPENYQKRILITIGTISYQDQEAMTKRIRKLAAKYPNYLFVYTSGNMGDGKKQEENMIFMDGIPYDPNMPQFDYVIHHAGAGIFYQTIKHNIPSLYFPIAHDQFDFSSRGEYHGAGIWTDEANFYQDFDVLVQRKDWSQLQALHDAYHKYQPKEVFIEQIARLIQMRPIQYSEIA